MTHFFENSVSECPTSGVENAESIELSIFAFTGCPQLSYFQVIELFIFIHIYSYLIQPDICLDVWGILGQNSTDCAHASQKQPRR